MVTAMWSPPSGHHGYNLISCHGDWLTCRGADSRRVVMHIVRFSPLARGSFSPAGPISRPGWLVPPDILVIKRLCRLFHLLGDLYVLRIHNAYVFRRMRSGYVSPTHAQCVRLSYARAVGTSRLRMRSLYVSPTHAQCVRLVYACALRTSRLRMRGVSRAGVDIRSVIIGRFYGPIIVLCPSGSFIAVCCLSVLVTPHTQ